MLIHGCTALLLALLQSGAVQTRRAGWLTLLPLQHFTQFTEFSLYLYHQNLNLVSVLKKSQYRRSHCCIFVRFITGIRLQNFLSAVAWAAGSPLTPCFCLIRDTVT